VEKGFEYCFDFDHLRDKIRNVSSMTSFSLNKIDQEIAKCQLLCCYCHVDKTIKQLGQYDEYFYKKINKETTVYEDKYDLVMKELKKTTKTIQKYHTVSKCRSYGKDKKCISCGYKICNGSLGWCYSCYHKSMRKAVRPPKEQLLKEIEELGYCGTGRKYGVSDNAIRKWLKKY
jgi:hypothetical protein